MARYQPYNLDQGKFIPVSFRDQILPGSFESAVHEIVEQQERIKGTFWLSSRIKGIAA